MDALTSMSTVAGYKAVLMAANRLPVHAHDCPAVGMLPPTTVTVIGTGVAGASGRGNCKRLGAVVHALTSGLTPQSTPRAWEQGRLIQVSRPR